MCNKSWMSILNLQPYNLNFGSLIFYSLSSFLKLSLFNLNFPFSTHLPLTSLKGTRYLSQNILKVTGCLKKCPQAQLLQLKTYSRSVSQQEKEQQQEKHQQKEDQQESHQNLPEE